MSNGSGTWFYRKGEESQTHAATRLKRSTVPRRAPPPGSWTWFFLFCGAQPEMWRLPWTPSLRVWPAPTGPQTPHLDSTRVSQTSDRTTWVTRKHIYTCIIPSSKYCTVESLEWLGSKSAIRGAMYCVAVSLRWVMSPVKINPKKKARWTGKKTKQKTYVRLDKALLPYKTPPPLWTYAGKVTRTSVGKSNVPPVATIICLR